MKWWVIIVLALALALGALAYYLLRPLRHKPSPATFDCLDIANGTHVPFEVAPTSIYGVGLAYAGHINETASDFTPGAAPPIFRKDPRALSKDGDYVALPSSEAIFAAADSLEPGLGTKLQSDHPSLPPLLDYETELAFVLLEDVTPEALGRDEFTPKLGFLIANDLSARSLAVLGEGQPNRYDYWGASKSFPGFLPIASKMWVPSEHKQRGLPCVTIETSVNGELRQQQNTSDLIYTPVEMLRFIHAKYPNQPLRRGDMVLTGTPAGVAMATPRWLVRLANLVGMDRFKKLDATLGKDQSRFLKAGDEVLVRGEGLGHVTVTISESLAN